MLEVTSGGASIANLEIGSGYVASGFSAISGTSNDTLISYQPCYCRGTRILTDRGEVAVEDLVIGDRLITLDGSERPLRWIGRRAYDGRFAARNPEVMPVRIRAGALGDEMPVRDLDVSPLHALYLDGVLIPAGRLVNGGSILALDQVESIEYFHLELETHDVILAEGAWAESYVDDHNRDMFQNAAEYRALYPDQPPADALYCAPRVEHGARVEAVREWLAVQAQRIGCPPVTQARMVLREGRNRIKLPAGVERLELVAPAHRSEGDARRLRNGGGMVRWTDAVAVLQLPGSERARECEVMVVAMSEAMKAAG